MSTSGYEEFVAKFGGPAQDPAELALLFRLKSEVDALGGFDVVYEKNLWRRLNCAALGLSPDQCFERFRDRLLVHVLKARVKNLNTKNFRPECLQRPLVVEADAELDFSRMQNIEEPVLLLKDRVGRWQMDASVFSPEIIAERHANVRIRMMF